MRRMHHRRYQGRFTCLRSLARSLTAPAAAGLLLALAVLLAIMPMPAQGNAQSATYRVTFEGKFTTSALASGVSVPSGAHFTTLIGAVHNGSVTFWSSGGTASAGVEAVAELGTTGAFKSEINAAILNALAVIEQSIASGPTATATLDITLTTDHPRVTLLTMIAPSPDWFVGVSGLSLRNTADDGWQPSLTVNLFPYDAGTEEGTEFSLNNSATSPQGTITSIKGMGKFSNEPIATLTFDLLTAPVITTTSPIFVPENDTAVATLTATDNDTPIDQLIWTIPSGTDGGADADHFTLTAAGVLAFSAAKDYENPDDADGDGNYEGTVQVSDGDNSVTADILVTLENVLELLSELSGPSSRNFAENGALRVATYTASSPEDNGDVTWLLSGTDSDDFSIDGGVLRFALEPASPSHKFPSLPDFESASDADTNNVYSITVIASDGSTTLTKNATITVSDENEAGVVTISPVRPRVGTALTATLTDPDGSTSGVAWTWQRSTGPTTWTAIDGANSSSYTPVAADAGHYLRATATYTDGHGAGQSAQAVAPYTPLAHQLSALSVTGPARGPYPAFDPDVLHYAMECAAGQTITLTLSAAESSTRVAVNGVQRPSQNAVVELTGLDGYSDIPITLSGGQGGATTYVLHCFQENFPDISTEQGPGATEELIGFSLNTRPGLDIYGFLVIVDNNGVPRVHRRIGTRANAFRPQSSETYPFSYSVPDAQTTDVWILVDRELNELERVTTVPPLLATDKHDFIILDNGDYLLLSYEPVLRDFSSLIDSDGNPAPPNPDRSDGRYSVQDTAIQIRPAAGAPKLTWYSWDHMAAQDCGRNPFPAGDWAHGNSLWMSDGVIVASFRACGKVLAIDAATGDVVWRLGRSYRAPEEWGSDELSGHGRGKGPAPMTILNDPYGEFCGQHSAQVLDNGHLLLYDNGFPCVRDPATGVSRRESGVFSRAVEYAIDPDNGEAIFQRHHSLHGDFNRGAWAAGLVEPMDNGDWLVSWGFSNGERITAVPVDESVTQVDPDTGTEKFSINVQIDHVGEESIHVRAYPLSPVTLADEPVALEAEIAVSASNSAVHTGPLDKPQVVVAFNQPVVDFTATASVSVQGATIESVSPHIVAGEPANAYLFTLTPTGVGPITFALAAGHSCATSGICTAGGSLLSEVPASSHVIPPRPTGPSVASITSSATHPTKDGFTVTITFSELVMGLEASEITVTHGIGSNFAGAAALYTLDIAPNADIEDDVTVTVMAGAVVDGVNKGNLEASAVFSVDTQAPVVSTVAITSIPGPDATYTPGEVIEATVTFSETVVVTGTPQLTLNVGGGGRRANYQSGVDAALLFSYTVVEGDTDTDGLSIEADSLSLNGGTIRDGADNVAILDHGAVTGQTGHTVDGVRPELAAAGGAVIDATTLTLTYDEPLDAGSDAEPGDFTVAGGDRARTVTRVVVRGASVELTLDLGAEHGEAGILVSYTPGMNPIRDVAGNEAEALSRVPVTNETPDTTAPAVSSLAINSNPGTDGTYAIGDGIEVTVRFDETVEVEGPTQLRLKVGSRSRTVSYLRGTGTAELVFGYEVVLGDEDTDGVSVDAGRVALNGGTLTDEAGNPAALDHETLPTQAGHQVDGIRPEFRSAAVDGSSLTLTYGEALDGGSRPAPGDFTVEVGSSGRTVAGVSINGSTVTLTLNPAVEHGETGIRVSYTPGTRPVRDAVGNDAVGLSNRPVTNTTGAPNTAPVITSTGPFAVGENQALVRRLAASDDDPGDAVTGWAITGGADGSQFTIASHTGDLSFVAGPDYESPADVASGDPPSGAGDNEYVVTVRVRSGTGARELEAEQTFTVSVTDEQERPTAPEAPSFSEETDDSLRVSWSKPENTGPPITDYDVQYREHGTERYIDAQHEGPGLSLTLADLEAGTTYEVQVRARNDEGTGDWSESGAGMTVVPLTVEMTIDIEPPVSGAFTVRFRFSEPVTGFARNDIETGQNPACTNAQNIPVFCQPGIGPLETIDDRVYTATLIPRTDPVAHNYTLTLTVPAGRATSAAGNKPNEQAMLEVRVAPPGVTVPVSAIGLSATAGDAEVRLQWRRPADEGGSPIIRYEYRYRAVGEEWSDWENVEAGASGVTVENLVNGREYVFEVRAVNALGKGPVERGMAEPARGTGTGTGGGGGGGGGGSGSRGTVPGAPANLTAVGGDGAVVLTWSAPENDGGSPIRDYQYRLDRRGDWISIGSTHTTHTVPGLVNDTPYVFEVRAVNGVGRSPASQPAAAKPRASVVLDFAHFANGGGITSEVVLVNVAPEPIQPVLYFYGPDGVPMAAASVVDVTDDLEIQDDGGLRVRTEMESLGELTIATHGRGPLVTGSVKVVAGGPIGGMLRFNLPGIGQAVVGPSPATRDAIFPVRRQEGGINTGVAIHNLESTAGLVRCELLRAGVLQDAASIPLAANGQTSWMIDAAFTMADTSDFAGSVRCSAVESGRFTAMALEIDPGNRIFTTLPVEEVSRSRGGETVLDFAHFANGIWITDLVFVNLSTQASGPPLTPFHSAILPSRPAIYFYDTAGNPIAAETVVDVTGDLKITEDGALTVRTEMEPLGVLMISTHGRGPLVSGSVRVISEGPISGMLRFGHPDLGVAGVGASPPVQDALFPVRRQEGGITTGVALHNLGAEAMRVSCRLMSAGSALDAVSIPLEANGQTAWLIDTAFPGADTSGFSGSVRCTAPGEGRFTALAAELDAGNRIFTTLPVVALSR